MKIISKEKSKLLDRTEVKAELSHIGKPTPSNNEIKKEIAKELKADEGLVIIKEIKTKYGEGTSLVLAFAYDNLEELKKLEKYEEPKKEEPSKAEEAPAEQPKEEAPKAEEKPKEEIKEENGKETETEKQSNE